MLLCGSLLGQRYAGGLAMGAQNQRLCILCPQLSHELVPERPRGAKLGHLEEEVHADAEKEAQPRREGIDIEASRLRRADILDAVGDGVGELLNCRRTGLVHVVAGDRNGVELRHVPGGVGDDVADDPHARLGRVDIGVADHELLEDVVLDGPVELRLAHPLLFGGDDEHGEHRQHGAIHGHRHAHLIERDTVEQDLHVLDAVDGGRRPCRHRR